MKKKIEAEKRLVHCGSSIAYLSFLDFFFFSAEMWQVSEELAGTSWFRACL